MARIPFIIERSQVAAEHQAKFDAIAASRGRVGGPFQVLLHSPKVAERTAHLGAYLRFESPLPEDLRELATLYMARESNCQYEFAAHAPQAREAGVSEAVIQAIIAGRMPDGLTPEQTTVLNYAQELSRSHRVSDATFQSALSLFGIEGLTEFTALLGYYAMLAFTLNAFDVPPVGTPPPLPE